MGAVRDPVPQFEPVLRQEVSSAPSTNLVFESYPWLILFKP